PASSGGQLPHLIPADTKKAPSGAFFIGCWLVTTRHRSYTRSSSPPVVIHARVAPVNPVLNGYLYHR
ncbi:hypothetical protein P3W53_19110, partial [Pseudomonas denitrificans (nom. rej.)]|nr:hypothetical protein [Pseudomonas denitrificans (nom. rej.)]